MRIYQMLCVALVVVLGSSMCWSKTINASSDGTAVIASKNDKVDFAWKAAKSNEPTTATVTLAAAPGSDIQTSGHLAQVAVMDGTTTVWSHFIDAGTYRQGGLKFPIPQNALTRATNIDVTVLADGRFSVSLTQ